MMMENKRSICSLEENSMKLAFSAILSNKKQYNPEAPEHCSETLVFFVLKSLRSKQLRLCFSRIEYQLPNLIACAITKESLYNAFDNGITSDQIITFLQQNSHPRCAGSSFTGDVQRVNPATNLHFRGARVWLAVMQELLAKGMRNADNAVLSGCSAGGLASLMHCDSFCALLPMGAKVKCLSDAGFFSQYKRCRRSSIH